MIRLKANDYLSQEERKILLKKNNWRATYEVLHTWLWISFAFALVYFFPNVFTVILALFILGGKQLACSVIMHDTGHRAMFTNPRVNDWVGKWLGAYPILHDMIRYRHYHYQHHVNVGTAEDPDLALIKGYPTSVRSMFRKIARDLSGATGIKGQIAVIMMHLNYLTYNLGGQVKRIVQKDRSWKEFLTTAFKNLSGPILANLILLALLSLLASPWLYLLWIGALLTTYNFSIRIRAIAEHSMVEDPTDQVRNTRTTYANWLERMLFAPHNVNYHLEHHMLMAVPPYNLPKMHKILKQKGFYREGLLEQGYWDIVKMAAGKKPIQMKHSH